MGYIVADKIEVSVFIAGTEYPLGLGVGNVLNYLHMSASTKFRLPQVCFSLLDVTHALDVVPLQDGTPIKLILKGDSAQAATYNFRRFNSRRVLTGDAWEYTIDGYWDAPRFWSGTAGDGINATSSQALAKIANLCGLGYEGVQTSDQMLWMPGNKKMHEFAQFISKAGYISDNSLMKWGVDFDGKLKYRDVNNLPDKDKPTKLIAYQTVPGAYTVIDYKPTGKSGFLNSATGYLNQRVIQSATGADLSTIEQQITFTSDTKAPDFNTALRDKTVRGKVTHSPINFGNVHPQFERAVYQNDRQSALFSMELEFLINAPTKISLFDTITFSTETEQQREDRSYSGTYIVTGRAIYAKGATYAEKIYAVRQGTNSAYNPQ